MKINETTETDITPVIEILQRYQASEDQLSTVQITVLIEKLRQLRIRFIPSDVSESENDLNTGHGHLLLLGLGEEFATIPPAGALKPEVNYAVRVIRSQEDGVDITNWELRIVALGKLLEAVDKSVIDSHFLHVCDYLEEPVIRSVTDKQENSAANVIDMFNPCNKVIRKALTCAWKGEYRNAEILLRECLDSAMLVHDRLTVINGLADVCFEQKRWHQAEKLAMKSIEAQPVQRTPYLILFKIAAITKNVQKAWDWLDKYREFEAEITRSNYDVRINEEDLCLLLADLSLMLGNTSDAFTFYERHFLLKIEKTEPSVVEKLLIYSIDTGNYDKAVLYFEHLFGSIIPEKLNDAESARLLEVISLFMDKEWYDYAEKICELVFNGNPKNTLLLRRWIATLAKTRNLDKARQVMQIALRKN
ncbi:MAG: tetratricopeptide repeat protein [Balneolaceae bacterium]|nr:MAG: tetratricopeptide repeat protein [Balneolaceae bacterium]